LVNEKGEWMLSSTDIWVKPVISGKIIELSLDMVTV